MEISGEKKIYEFYDSLPSLGKIKGKLEATERIRIMSENMTEEPDDEPNEAADEETDEPDEAIDEEIDESDEMMDEVTDKKIDQTDQETEKEINENTKDADDR